jgi:hypothetical protein
LVPCDAESMDGLIVEPWPALGWCFAASLFRLRHTRHAIPSAAQRPRKPEVERIAENLAAV